jgi:predicted  nucleic acid-binding Zn-ribbon protein
MEKLKNIFSSLSVPVWIGISIVLIVICFWLSGTIGNWVEKRKQAQFDAQQQVKQKQIDDLTQDRDGWKSKAKEAEAREQVKSQEADTLRALIADKGGKIEQEAKKIENAQKKFENDNSIIEQAKNGQISKYDLCQKQCSDSASIGFPCRKTYCDIFKGQ